jgi:hypothetical protein
LTISVEKPVGRNVVPGTEAGRDLRAYGALLALQALEFCFSRTEFGELASHRRIIVQ